MKSLWSPWRSKYIQSFKDESCEHQTTCFFCDVTNSSKEKDAELLVVARNELCFVMLNKFPYNSSHLLIAPYRHIGDLNLLTDAEMKEIMQTVRDSITVLDNTIKPHGYNAGLNLGRVAGAGVPEHIHFHVVPRWNGDTSFMAVLAEVKIISEALEETQKILSAAFNDLYHY